MKRLTIGLPVYDDYDGVFFTLQALRMYHPMDEVELLVVDNNPDSAHGKATRKFSEDAGARYIPAADANGAAATKNQIFEHATTPFVMCIDCHVLLWADSVRRLLEYLETDPPDLLHGPLIYNDLHHLSTHMDVVWRGGALGIWANDPRGSQLDALPFEIPAQGMGLFVCRRDTWPGFHPAMRGFGGEEVYIHRKVRLQGHRVLCLPFLRWAHRFGRPSGVPFPNRWEDRIFNHLLGHLELGFPVGDVMQHFKSLNLANFLSVCLKEARQQILC
jgi:hypothetical protein